MLLGTYAFAFQIYGDFAGYSNIARGTSKLMGIELIENFRFPYFVRSAAGVLAPLAHQPLDLAARLPVHPARRQPRIGAGRRDRNLLITMVLGGLWHGAAWTFVLWGLYPRAAPDRVSRGASRFQSSGDGCSAPHRLRGRSAGP